MEQLKEQLRHKYAYNINDNTKGKKGRVGSNFLKLNGGFYDDIENNDISIKQKQKLLQKIKNESLKEFVFTNKEVPDKWKKKLNYQNDVIKVLANDNDFLLYIGRGSKQAMAETISTALSSSDNFQKNYKNIHGLKTSYSQLFPKIKSRFSSEERKTLRNEYNSNANKTLDEDLSNNENTASVSKSPYPKLKSHNKKETMSDKDIVNLLDEFRILYPIKVKKEDQHKPEFELELENSIDRKNKSPKNNLLFYNTFLQMNKSSNPFANIHKMKLDKRQRAFRQNIFNNLIPPKNKKSLKSNSMVNLSPSYRFKNMKIKKEENEQKFGPFLNFDHNSFYKKTKISDPMVKKSLEFINYYGPYYSYCPPCLNRNLEYYNNLEPNQCLKLINYIKKIRGKKNILNLKETAFSTTNRKTEKKSSFDEDIGKTIDNESAKILEKTESFEFSQ
jgi:hypothetical protein